MNDKYIAVSVEENLFAVPRTVFSTRRFILPNGKYYQITVKGTASLRIDEVRFQDQALAGQSIRRFAKTRNAVIAIPMRAPDADDALTENRVRQWFDAVCLDGCNVHDTEALFDAKGIIRKMLRELPTVMHYPDGAGNFKAFFWTAEKTIWTIDPQTVNKLIRLGTYTKYLKEILSTYQEGNRLRRQTLYRITCGKPQ